MIINQVSASRSPTLQSKTNISPTTSSQTITADAGYDGLSSVQINAMPTGSAGTPSATKGSVSNHAITITPSVTNTTGYITGGTKTGTAVSVSASELVDGIKYVYSDIDGQGAWDVANYKYCSYDYAPLKDNKIRLWFDINSTNGMTAKIYCQKSSGKTTLTDWGDGSTTSGSSSGNSINQTHTYSQSGRYVVTITGNGSPTYFNPGQYAVQQTSSAHNTNLIGVELYQAQYNNSQGSEFRYCDNLKKVSVVGNGERLAAYSFADCQSLEYASFEGLPIISSGIFYNCTSLKKVDIKTGVTTMQGAEFSGCSSLTDVNLPNTLTNIANGSFRNCTSLTAINLPTSLTEIAALAFYSCTALTKITIPQNVTTIGDRPFLGCTGLVEIHMKPTSVPTLANNGLMNSADINANLVIYVPTGCLNAYQTATSWTRYASRMVEE